MLIARNSVLIAIGDVAPDMPIEHPKDAPPTHTYLLFKVPLEDARLVASSFLQKVTLKVELPK